MYPFDKNPSGIQTLKFSRKPCFGQRSGPDEVDIARGTAYSSLKKTTQQNLNASCRSLRVRTLEHLNS